VAAIGVVVVPGIGPAVLGSPGLGLIGGDTFGQPVGVRATLDTEVRLPGAPRIVDSANGSVDSLTGGRPVEVTGPFDAQVTLLSPTAGQRALSITSSVAGPLVALVVIVLLLLIVRTIDGGDPFVLANARRLQWIAFVVGAGGLLAQGLGDQARNELLVSSAAGGIVRYAFEFSFPPIVAGLGILTLAEVLRRGALMRADLEGLV
jgi:hypothetical protein